MITALYVTYNEGEFLARSIASVKMAVEKVIVVDANSDDETEETCRNIPGVEWHEAPGRFGDVGRCVVRNYSLSFVKTPWVMVLDGDEIMQDDWLKVIQPMLVDSTGAICFRRWEHVGSYEYIRRGLEEFPPRIYRMSPDLKYLGSGVERFQANGAHGAFADFSPNVVQNAETSMFHYGYARRDLGDKFLRDVHRHDWTDEKLLEMLGRVQKFGPLGWLPLVDPVPYPIETVPAFMKPHFGKTYKLLVNNEGQIHGRIRL